MSKYKSKPTVIDGIRFASRKEAQRYTELRLLERAGQISGLRLQVPYELIPKHGRERAIKYIADFVYNEDGQTIVEDVKGYRTDVYKLKRRLMYERYGIEIREV